MAASSQAAPTGGYNNIGVDYIGPKTVGGDIVIVGEAAATTHIATFKKSGTSFSVDHILEQTAAHGVNIDGVVLKDSDVVADDVTATNVTVSDMLTLPSPETVTVVAGAAAFTKSHALLTSASPVNVTTFSGLANHGILILGAAVGSASITLKHDGSGTIRLFYEEDYTFPHHSTRLLFVRSGTAFIQIGSRES